MRDCDIDELGDEFLRRRLAYKKPHVVESVRYPREENDEGNDDGADRVQVLYRHPPLALVISEKSE